MLGSRLMVRSAGDIDSIFGRILLEKVPGVLLISSIIAMSSESEELLSKSDLEKMIGSILGEGTTLIISKLISSHSASDL